MSKPTVTDADLSADLSSDPKNANKGTKRGRKMLAKSVVELGAARSIVADKNGLVVAGNKTREAAVAAGMKNAIVVETDGSQLVVVRRTDWDLTDPTGAARRYAIADNRIAEVDLDFDEEVLKSAMNDGLNLEEFWSQAELRSLLGNSAAGMKEGDDDVIDPPPVAVTQPGDLWLLGEHRVYCGSSTDADSYKQACGPLKPQIMVTDPPYGVNFDPEWRQKAGVHRAPVRSGVKNDDRADWRDAYVLFRGDVAYVWHGGNDEALVVRNLADCTFEQRSQIIWYKIASGQISRSHYHWRHESCVYAVRKGKRSRWCGDRKQSTVWEMKSPLQRSATAEGDDEATEHGTQKPLEAMLRPIINHGERGDAVYDPFGGSGTTLIAAERAGRRCAMVELDGRYVDVIVERWQKATGGVAQLAPGSPGLAGRARPEPVPAAVEPDAAGKQADQGDRP